jgi:hypothetical protein
MSNKVTKVITPAAPAKQPEDSGSRLKNNLMEDMLARMLGKADSEQPAAGVPRVILALANHVRSGWDRAQQLQRRMFEAAGAGGLEMKFAFYGPDDATLTRRCRITKDWHTDADSMGGVIGRAECNCGCYLNVRAALAQAVKEGELRPLRAVVVVTDAFHDSQESLDEAAIAANQLRRMGTRLFLIQLGNDDATARKLEYLVRVASAVRFHFDPRTQEQQFTELWAAVSAFAAGGEEAVQKTGGPAAPLLLKHFKQAPMPIVDEGVEAREHVRANRDIKK